MPILEQWHHMAKTSHAAPHLDDLALRNAVVPLLMSLASHDANASASCVISPKCYAVPHFNHLDLRNTVVPQCCQYHVMPVPAPD